ncbi:MAG: hypothetical protein COT88_01855 [Candidatus Colwellbacteria bacterium CG10_big_fil_rev_8_21_14_0_10_41_28]|uniref:Uncharacterized protein n=1 Tax=Candidatus Colwellbacteria bacterium CG10_big_fil_rev_8_21_14_0_10_41_28 TaxID=1974539 RepID=A0A2H0VJ75_9BACT|nr:MAG: hypothetical protein COT88_01855 [Candidatus Colwellbacteria bacterium CG10_big_fil_rev_8_21_14_0_10_41_28]
MKRKYIIPGLMAIALFALPAVSLANTYQFVDTSGDLQSMEAANSSIALNTAPELGVHSGVILVEEGGIGGLVLPDDNPPANSGSDNYYQFVDTSGDIQGVWAASPSEALNTAHELGIHSGVILVDGTILVD